uniref:Uncharacterized protein n=1 Tax=Arundo donax TaxID=35708 RepID=A0A0A9FRQ7_ARUDO
MSSRGTETRTSLSEKFTNTSLPKGFACHPYICDKDSLLIKWTVEFVAQVTSARSFSPPLILSFDGGLYAI